MSEKDYNPEQKMKKANKAQEQVAKASLKPTQKKVEKAPIVEEKKDEENKSTENVDNKKEDKKKVVPKKKAPTKTEVVTNLKSANVSTKYAIAICKFLKGKTIEKAMLDLENVLAGKIAVPMKGEYGHKKSVKGIASGAGRFPKNATKVFISVVKSLQGNANNHEVENPFISEAIANKSATPMARFGSWQRKRTHITLKAKSKKELNKNKKKNGRAK